MATPRTCPYHQCQSSAFNRVTDSVAACANCGSLASRCREKDCLSWNRSFARFCRLCGRELRDTSDVWEQLRTANPVGGTIWVGEKVTVADLSEHDGAANSRSYRVAISAAQGFLVLHQAGGFVALVRPFSRSTDRLAFWLREPESQSRAAPAYDPVIMPGGRFLLLADRREVSVIDLWKTDISVRYRQLKESTRFVPAAPIAAAPIALGEKKVGLLLGASSSPDSYAWMIWDFSRTDAPRPLARPLPEITGGPCEASLVAGKTLAIATPEGHWVWRLDDAQAGRDQMIRRTWNSSQMADSAGVVISRRATNPEAFSRPSQIFRPDQAGDRFYWLFRTSDGYARSYRVRTESLTEADRTLDTDTRSEFEGTSPIGLAEGSGLDGRSTIFEKNHRLYHEGVVAGNLRPSQASLPPDAGAGLQLVGNLVVTIGAAPGGARSRPVHIQSLSGAHISSVEIPGLSSEPFVWSGHLFTVERSREDHLTLERRELKSISEEMR